MSNQSNNLVELRPLAVVDLAFSYARKMGGNKIRHYRVPALFSVVQGLEQSNPFQTVSEFIKKEEPGVEVVEVPSVIPKKISSSASLQVTDVSKETLGHLPGILKNLNKVKANQLVHQYLAPNSRIDGIKGTIAQAINNSINFFLRRKDFLGRPIQHVDANKYYKRHMAPVSFLAYTYQEPDEEVALQALRNDLIILNQRGLILGHLTLPSALYLADTIGSGFATKVLFCFLITDIDKLNKQENRNPLETPRLPLNAIGLKGETLEGGLGFQISGNKDYDIEEIEVPLLQTEESIKAYVDNYLENVEFVNEAALKQANKLANSNIETSSEQVGKNLHINMKITKKEE